MHACDIKLYTSTYFKLPPAGASAEAITKINKLTSDLYRNICQQLLDI